MYDGISREPGPVPRLKDTQLRDHAFMPDDEALKAIPGPFETEVVPPALRIIHLHYHCTAGDWWVCEVYPDRYLTDSSEWHAFGYIRLISEPDQARWDQFSLTELERMQINGINVLIDGKPDLIAHQIVVRDVDFRPTAAGECIPDLPAPADDHGYPYVQLWARQFEPGISEADLAARCKQAADDGAPRTAYLKHNGSWLTLDTASKRTRYLLGIDVEEDGNG